MEPFQTALFDHLWIPADASVPRPRQKVMIVLHGGGDSLEAYRNIQGELQNEKLNFLVLNAPRRYQDGYTWCAVNPKPGSPSLLAIRARLFALVLELGAAGWQPNEIAWLGHSQGAMVAADVVLNHRETFAGMIAVSGYVSLARGWKSRLSRSRAADTPWLMTHGTRDRIIHLQEFRGDVARLLDGPVRLEYREFPKGHDFDFSREVPFIRRWITRTVLRS